MKNHPLRYVTLLIMLLMLLFVLGRSPNVFAQEAAETVYITSPADGATVSGLITLTGAAAFADFLKYEIFLKQGDNLLWGATVYAPVVNGNLARLDTRTYINGTYQLVIRQVNNDSNYTDFIGPTITINNSGGAPLPHPEIEPNFLYPVEGFALMRVRNCTGINLEFDYTSPMGFHSSGNLWIMGKMEDAPICPFEDFILIPGEYRGTAVGEGEERAYTYMFQAEAGEIYEFTYNGVGAGQFQLVINQIEGDERASTDTGALNQQAEPAASTGALPTTGNTSASTSAPAAPAPGPAPTAGVATPAQTMLPVSGEEPASNLPFIVAGIGLILFLVGGGVLAARRRSHTA